MSAKSRDSRFQVKLGELIRMPSAVAAAAPPPPPAPVRDRNDLSAMTREEIDARLNELIAKGKADGQFSIVVTVGAEAARAILARSAGNIRKESRAFVDRMARDILEGNWRLTSESIEIDRDGRARDGHHRLAAVIAADRSIRVSLMFGTDPDSHKYIDQGRVRSVHNVLNIPAKHAAIVKAALRLYEGRHSHLVFSGAEIERAYLILGSAFEAVLRGVKTPKFPVGFWAVLVLLYEKHADTVSRFAAEVYDGGEVLHSAARTLRDYLLENRGSSAGQGYDDRVSTYTLYAFKAYIDGRPLTRFSPRDRDKEGNRVTPGDNSVTTWFRRQIGAES